MRLTQKQSSVIKLMRQGWALWRLSRLLNASTPLPDGYRLQQGGRGKGGHVVKVSGRTVSSLIELMLITTDNSKDYSLTRFGEIIDL